MPITEATVRTATVDSGKCEKLIFDDEIPGFGIRLREGGSKTFVFQYRRGTKQHRMKLGIATASAVADVRKIAKKLYHRVQLGEDPANEKHEAKRLAAQSFKSIAEEYLEHQKPNWKRRTHSDVSRNLLVHAKPLHQLSIGNVRRADISGLHSALTKKGSFLANRVSEAISGLFSWGITRGRVEENPTMLSPRNEEKSRDRVLTPVELRLLWNHVEADEYGAIIKLIALTGQRPGEIGGLRWSQIHGDSIVMETTKNGQPHVVPLSAPAQEILAQHKRQPDRDYIFGFRGKKPFDSWSMYKNGLNDRILASTGKMIEDWRPHDLRRTFSTLAGGGLPEHQLAKLTGRDKELASGLGIEPYLLDAILNHVSGRSTVERTYNRSTYAAQKRQALERWAEHLLCIVENRDPVILQMRRA